MIARHTYGEAENDIRNFAESTIRVNPDNFEKKYQGAPGSTLGVGLELLMTLCLRNTTEWRRNEKTT